MIQIQPLKLIRSWKGVEVIQAITPRGIRVVKRAAISPDGEVDAGLLHEIEIHKLIRTLPANLARSLIRPIDIYISGPGSIEEHNRYEPAYTRYLCVEMEMGGGDVYDIEDRNPVTDIQIMKAAIEGIIVLHSLGYCYADLKPDNILFFTDNRASITHFELIDFNTTFHRSRPQDAKYGTPQWMSPDLFFLVDGEDPESVSKFDYRSSDYWSIGCLAYYLMTGCHLIQSSTIDDYRKEIMTLDIPNLPSESIGPIGDLLVSIIRSALHIDPHSRTFDPYQTLMEIYLLTETPVSRLDEFLEFRKAREINKTNNDDYDDDDYDDDDDDDDDYDDDDSNGNNVESDKNSESHSIPDIFPILVNLIQIAIDSTATPKHIDLRMEIETIIEKTITLVNKHIETLKLPFSDLLFEKNEYVHNFFENQWRILSLLHTIKLFDIFLNVNVIYSTMEEYLIHSSVDATPAVKRVMTELTKRMVFDRSLNILLDLEIETISLNPIPIF